MASAWSRRRRERRMYEVLPLDGERERGTMPQRSPSEGVLATLKGTTPGDLEGDLPCDPGGEENVESKRACKASEDDVACFDDPNNLKALTWPPKESVGWHNRNETTTHLHQSWSRPVFVFEVHREGTHAVLGESKSKSNWPSHSCHAWSRTSSLLPAPLLAVSHFVDYVDFEFLPTAPSSTSLLPFVFVGLPLPTPANPLPLAGSDLASCMDAAPGPINAAPPPHLPRPLLLL